MIKKLYALLYADENILYFNEDSDDAVFSCNEIDILCVDLNILTLMILIMIAMVLKLLFISDFWRRIVNLKKAKHLKKISDELISIACHPQRWWNF